MGDDIPLPGLSDPYELPERATREFAEKGYVRLDGIVSPDEISAYAAIVDEVARRSGLNPRPLEERDTFGRAFLQFSRLRFRDPRVQAFFCSVRFARIAGQLLGVNAIRGYHDQALFKEPSGGLTPWHQAQFYWPFEGNDALSMWMPIQDVTPDMGVPRLAAGSHRLGSMGDFHMGDESHAALGQIVKDMSLDVLPPAPYKAGDAVFYRGWTFCSETANTTQEMRRAVNMVYFADGMRVGRLDHPVRILLRDSFFPNADVGDFAASDQTQVLWRKPLGD